MRIHDDPENQSSTEEIDLDNDEQVDRALQEAVRDALREHKRRGQSIVVWQDGQIVTLAPEDIPVDLADKAARPMAVCAGGANRAAP